VADAGGGVVVADDGVEPTPGEGVAVRAVVDGTAVAVDGGALPRPPQATATANNSTREARVNFTSLMLLSRPTGGN